MLWTCAEPKCGCTYAPAPRCPQCGSTKIKEKNVAKIDPLGNVTDATVVKSVDPEVKTKKAKGFVGEPVAEPVEDVSDLEGIETADADFDDEEAPDVSILGGVAGSEDVEDDAGTDDELSEVRDGS